MAQKYSKPAPDIARAESAIAKLATAYPNVTEDRPWGHSAFKIAGKTFLFLSADGSGLGLSVKLPLSGKQALTLGFTEPTHYGLGKSGWVSAHVTVASKLSLALVKTWLDESFRAIAPKKLVETLPSAKKPASRRKPASPGKVRAARKAKAAAPRKAGSPATRKSKARRAERSAAKKR